MLIAITDTDGDTHFINTMHIVIVEVDKARGNRIHLSNGTSVPIGDVPHGILALVSDASEDDIVF